MRENDRIFQEIAAVKVILFSIFRLSSSIIILTFSCSTDLSLNFSHRLPTHFPLSSIFYV